MVNISNTLPKSGTFLLGHPVCGVFCSKVATFCDHLLSALHLCGHVCGHVQHGYAGCVEGIHSPFKVAVRKNQKTAFADGQLQ